MHPQLGGFSMAMLDYRREECVVLNHWAMKKHWLFRVLYRGLYCHILPGYVGIVIDHHYKDPYETTSKTESKRVFLVARLISSHVLCSDSTWAPLENIWGWYPVDDEEISTEEPAKFGSECFIINRYISMSGGFCRISNKNIKHCPIGSMYDIFTYIYHINQPSM